MAHKHNSEVKEHYAHSNPYPKHIHPESAKASHVAPDLDLGKMRKHAHSIQTDKSNQPNAELNRMDKEHGPVKGGC